MKKYFLENINIWLILAGLLVLVYLVVSLRSFIDWRAVVKGEDPGAKFKYILSRRSAQFIYKQILFPQAMMLVVSVYLSNLLYMLVETQQQAQINSVEMTSLVVQYVVTYAVVGVFVFETISSLKQFVSSK